MASKDETSISTKEEKQILIDAMHADGKDWDADKKQIFFQDLAVQFLVLKILFAFQPLQSCFLIFLRLL